MTCIVGVENNGSVFLGGDIQGTGFNSIIHHTQPKVFHKGEIVFGYTTSYRFGQLIEHHLNDPYVPDDKSGIYNWLVRDIIPEVRKVLKDHEWNSGGNALIGIRDELWELQPDFSILRSVAGCNAVGSGEEYARGALYSMMQMREPVYPKRMIQIAIEAAAEHSPTVGKEASIIHT